MRVVVANLTGGGLSGGYRKYLHRLMPRMAADRRVEQLTIFVPRTAEASLDRALDVRRYDVTDAGVRTLADEVRALAPDVVFVPTARFLPFGRPTVTMVRNMEPLMVPFAGNAFREGIRNLGRAGQAKRASRSATRVIAVSKFVREFLLTRWGIPPERVGLVYHGVDPWPPAGTVQNRVLFTAGSIRPARGLEDVINALAELPPDVQLRIAGRVDAGAERYAKQLHEIAESVGVARRITWMGQLSDPQMHTQLSTCAVFVMTSRAEACPNTALEAMSAGSVIVSVDHEPMPEFFGDAALYYRAPDAEALAARVVDLLEGRVDRAALQARAHARAAQFSWDATCDLTIRELEIARA
jgi:glycosyltransferase involved in cell wall biosynthesis